MDEASEAAEKVLLARGHFAIFTASVFGDCFSLFCPASGEAVQAKSTDVRKCLEWMLRRTDIAVQAACIVFPTKRHKDLEVFLESLVKLAVEGRVVVGPDAWQVVHDAFKRQRELVKITMPSGMEHASVLLTNNLFSPANVMVSSLNEALPTPSLNTAGACRAAVLAWDVLFQTHRRFGTPGSKKLQSPVDQIIRRAIRAVNVFVVDVNSRVCKTTLADGFTLSVTVYNAQKKNNTVTNFRNVSTEKEKVEALSVLFYGEGASSVTMLIPTPRTTSAQVLSVARMCLPKCPFFVASPEQMSPFFDGVPISFGGEPPSDPKAVWSALLAACFPGVAKKHDEENDIKLVRAWTAVANHQLAVRKALVAASAIYSANNLPTFDEAEDFQTARRLAVKTSTNSRNVTDATFLNKVNIEDSSVIFRLQSWLDNIYKNPSRLQREEAALKSVEKYIVVDLETTTTKRYKRVANPFTGENHVVLSGALDYKGTVFMPNAYFDKTTAQQYGDLAVTEPNNNVAGSSRRSLFLPPLDDYDVIVGHNLKFDLHHLWKDHELRAFLKRGGKIWDTMYAEYLLTGHQVKLGKGAGLEDVAKSYGGTTPKLDAVKQAWADGKQTYEIPYATLREYLMGDLRNTELIFLKHRPRALEQRQVQIIIARMDGLLATTEMEFNGLKTDVALAIRQSNELVAKATKLRQEMDEAIPRELPPLLQKHFNWASNQHLIAYFFGGKLKVNTASRASKALPGQKFGRHDLFAAPPTLPHLLPTTQATAGAECAVMAGFAEAEKGTRTYKCYLDAYVKATGFRKSSSLVDNLSKMFVTVSPKTPEQRSSPDAIVNLLPKRYLPMYAAVQAPATPGPVLELYLLSSVSGAALSIKATDNDRAKKLLHFIESEVEEHTFRLIPPSDNADPSVKPTAFVAAQVLFIARDAPYTFWQALSNDDELRSALEQCCAHFPANATVRTDFLVTLVDATATLLMYMYTHGEASYNEMKKKTQDPSNMPVPQSLLPVIPSNTKKANQSAAELDHLTREAAESPSDWAHRYKNGFAQMASRIWNLESAPAEKVAKKVKKNGPPAKDESALPLLLRERHTIAQALNSNEASNLSPQQKETLLLMMLFGRTCGTPYDAFSIASDFEEEVEVSLSGRLAANEKCQKQTELILSKFRSPLTRQLQVGDESLAFFSKTYNDKVAENIVELRQMEKLLGTYYEHTEGGTGMVSLVHTTDSCIHHELQHNKTSTGRLASSNPNCQNIPKEDKSPLREMFVSRFGPTGRCIEADYSQLEVITLAALANDEQMLSDLRNNVDFHCKRVTMIRPDLTYEEVLQRAKKNKEPEFVKLRQQAKVFSFQRQYGAGITMLSESTGLSRDIVKALIEREKEVYKDCDTFTNMVTLSANTYDATLQDGSRNVKGHQLFKGMFPVITGSRYVFTESDMPDSIMENKPANTKSTSFSPTHIKNYPVQGFAGEIVQIMLGKLWRHFVANENYGGLAVLTNTVHDCVWVDTTKDLYVQVARDVERIMSSAKEELNRLWPEMECQPIFPVDVVAGENMCHLKGLPKDKK